MIGDTVYVNGEGDYRGKICYIGEVHFAKGEFAGVVLDHPVGKPRMCNKFQSKPLHQKTRCKQETTTERTGAAGTSSATRTTGYSPDSEKSQRSRWSQRQTTTPHAGCTGNQHHQGQWGKCHRSLSAPAQGAGLFQNLLHPLRLLTSILLIKRDMTAGPTSRLENASSLQAPLEKLKLEFLDTLDASNLLMVRLTIFEAGFLASEWWMHFCWTVWFICRGMGRDRVVPPTGEERWNRSRSSVSTTIIKQSWFPITTLKQLAK